MLSAVSRVMGSSPHVRGAPLHGGAARARPGIIPACAGSTDWQTTRLAFARDHPRMCGEHTITLTNGDKQQGSSPHVRGAHGALHGLASCHGIIPACAGSTQACWIERSFRWDHPRMCGEHRLRHLRPQDPHGIIPACAGSTSRCRGWSRSTRDHPRMCGEHNGLLWVGDCQVGIIPACAGSTTPWACRSHRHRDHPRMCGEHTERVGDSKGKQGSSPHVRGAPRPCGPCGRWSGDHPRMCGEHSTVPFGAIARRGSSPHVRGAQSSRFARSR